MNFGNDAHFHPISDAIQVLYVSPKTFQPGSFGGVFLRSQILHGTVTLEETK